MRLAAFTLVLLLGSCATFGIGGVDVDDTVDRAIKDVCKVWKPISYDSTKDTEQTVKEVRANNRAREEYCE